MRFADKYSRLELMLYAISWAVIFLIPVGMETYDVLSGDVHAFNVGHVAHVELTLFPIFLLFLLNDLVLLPLLFFRMKRYRKLWYLLAIVACFALLWYIQVPPEPRHAHPMADGCAAPRPPIDMFHLTNLIIEMCVVLANLAIKLYIRSLRNEVVMLSIRNDKIQSELDSLKYQISPHFLMNSLNNIQSLIDTDASRAYHTIQALSRMMRYMLYENDTPAVSLNKEIDFMTDFIDMMKLRYPSEAVTISAIFPVDATHVAVPPLLFISFLENAFKHGVSFTGESFVSINMSVQHDRVIFRCANSLHPRKHSAPTPAGGARKGIGLENVKRRLQLLYGGDYTLDIDSTDKVYTVFIEIPVHHPKAPQI